MIDGEDWYLDREQQYGQGYTERAIELAYKIIMSLEILDPFDQSQLSFSLNGVTDSKYNGLEFKVYFDLKTSWEVATAGPIGISITLPTLDEAPDFTNAPTSN